MRRLKIEHLTEYRFGAAVTLLPHRLLLRPRESHNLRIASSALTISPAHRVRWQRCPFDNSVAEVTFLEPASVLRIESDIVVEHYDEAPLEFLVDEYAAVHPFMYSAEDATNLAPLRLMAWPEDRAAIDSWLRRQGFSSTKVETFALLDRLNRGISSWFSYQAREQPGVQSPATTLALGSGSCRDLSALFLEACRHLGFATRFVSGYQATYLSELGPGSTHAWAEVYLPGPGWKGFDPTAGIITGSDHIAVAVARHPEAVPPVAGSYLGYAHSAPTLHVDVRVRGA